jgi:hypothetical protein
MTGGCGRCTYFTSKLLLYMCPDTAADAAGLAAVAHSRTRRRLVGYVGEFRGEGPSV